MTNQRSSVAASSPVNLLIAEFLERRERGEPVDPATFLAQHSEHADELKSFFAGVDLLRQAAGADAAVPQASEQASQRRSQDETATVAPVSVRASQATATLPLSERFGRYQIVKLLGQGGMGSVYLARDTELHRDVALKIPLLQGPDVDELVVRFRREAQAAAALQHPNICPVHDVGEIDGRLYLTMAFIEGHPLTKYVSADKPQPQRHVAVLVRKLALALAEAHKRGVVHRDLKPANIMIDERNEPVVMDFGLARRVAGPHDVQITQSGMIVGSPAYMSPEQIAGDPARIGPSCDIWSLGVILFELLTGRLPYQGNLLQVVGAIQHSDAPAPSTIRPGIDPQLEAVCRKMLSRDAGQRYQTMHEVAQALAACLKTLGKADAASEPSLAAKRTAPTSRDPQESRTKVEQDAGSIVQSVGQKPRRSPPSTKPSAKPAAKPAAAKPSPPVRRPPTWALATGGGLLGVLLLAGVITLLFRNGDVTMQVELDDSLKNENVTFTLDGDTYEIGNLGQTIKVKPGPHGLEVKRGDESFKTNEYTISRGEKPVLRITLLDRKLTVIRDPAGTANAVAGTNTFPWKAYGKAWHGWPEHAPPPAIAPFDADQAKRHQKEWAKYLGVPVDYTNSIGMKFRLIPPGEFMMGSTQAEIDAALTEVPPGDERKYTSDRFHSELPRHRVILTKPMYLGMHEVTQAQYAVILNENPSAHAANGSLKDRVVGLDTSRFPVDSVTWNDASRFAATLSTRENRIRGLSGDNASFAASIRYQLPSDALWEFACRSGTTTKFWTGDIIDTFKTTAWFFETSGDRTHTVGELKANPFGLFDVHGNVLEWVQDRWDPGYYREFVSQPAIDPLGPATGVDRVYRGGGLSNIAELCRSSAHHAATTGHRWHSLGFRVAMPIDAPQTAQSVKVAGRGASLSSLANWHGWPADAPLPAIAPFTAEQAKQHQEAWAKHLGLPVEYTNSVGIRFRLIPPGEFLRGSPAADVAVEARPKEFASSHDAYCRSETPQHRTVITRPFYLAVHELTQRQYQAVTGNNPSSFAATGMEKDKAAATAVAGLDTSENPVETVTWTEGTAYCATLSEREGLGVRYRRQDDEVTFHEANGYRLPTEAEWELGARAGTTTRYWTGDSIDSALRVSWLTNGERTHAVGELEANPFGLFDVHGNAWEFVEDWWEETTYDRFAQRHAVDPSVSQATGDASERGRVIRGSGYGDHDYFARSAYRMPYDPDSSYRNVGFRLVLPVEGVRRLLEKGIGSAGEAPVRPKSAGWPADAPPPAVAPFTAEQAARHQEAWARYLGVPVEYTNSIGMRFRLIPPGEFLMGSTPEEIKAALKEFTGYREVIRSQGPQHRVVLTQPFYLGVHEVTQRQLRTILGAQWSLATPFFSKEGPRPEHARKVEGLDTDDFPTEDLQFNFAADFTAKLCLKENMKPSYFSTGGSITTFLRKGDGYRLPTEAEWEFACRAGSTTRFSFGDDASELARFGWFKDRSDGRPHPVGQLQANPFGLFDMHGNLYEWVQDRWSATYYSQFADRPAIDPTGPPFKVVTASLPLVIRGGAYEDTPIVGASGFRFSRPLFAAPQIGFRVALPVSAVQKLQRAAEPAEAEVPR